MKSIIATSLLITATAAVGPVSTKSYFTKVSVYPGSNWGANSVKIDFDQAIYLKNKTTGALTKLTDASLAKDDSITYSYYGYNYTTIYPHISVLTVGALQVQCTQVGQPYALFDTAYYEKSLSSFPFSITPPNAVPVESFQKRFYGSYGTIPVNYTLYPNRISAYINSDFTNSSNTICTIKGHNPSSDVLFTNAAGEEIQFPITIQNQDNQCSEENTLAITQYIKAVSDNAASYSSTSQIWSLNNLFNMLSTKEGFYACQSLIEQFVSTENATVTISGSYDCRYQWGDPRYDADPCCSWTARQYQCCKPYSYFQNITVAAGVNFDTISTECASPYQVEATLLQAATALNSQTDLNSFSYQKVYTDYNYYNSFTQTCYNKVWQQKSCTTNADCTYSGKCGTRGYCFVDYYNQAPALLKCFISEMKPELLAVIQKSLGVSAVFDSETAKSQALAEAALAKYSVETCVGQNAWSYATSYQYVLNSTSGNYERQLVLGNKTACLGVGQCSIEPYNRNTKESCLANWSPACMNCDPDYGYCWQVSVPGYCRISKLTGMTTVQFSSQCSQLNGTETYPGTSYSYCDIPSRSANKSSCYAGFEDACYKNGNEIQYCYTACINKNITDWNTCYAKGSQAGTYGYISNNVCHFSTYDQSTCLAIGNTTFINPPYYSQPYLNDKSSCEVPLCNYYISDRTNATLCASYGWCSEPCPSCVLNNFYGKDGACINPSILTNDACTTRGGYWYAGYNTPATNTTACSFYSLDTQQKCSQANHTWITPSMGTNASSCAALYPLATGAYWSYWQSCPNRKACTTQGGSCNDYEYGQTGICLYPANTTTSYPTCSGGGLDYVFWATGKHCIKSSVTTESDCTAAGSDYIWKKRATSATECVAKTPYCIGRDGSWINTDTEGCLACGGTQYARYSWNTPYWTPAAMSAYNWVNQPEWTSANNWTKTVDQNMLYYIMDDAIGTLLVNQYLEKYNKYYGVLTTAFNAIACSCYSGNDASVCFTADSLTSKTGNCDKNPSAPSTCQGLSYSSSAFNSTNVVSINVSVSNPAAFMSTNLGSSNDSANSASISRIKSSKFALHSKASKKPSKKQVTTAAYTVVKNDNGGLCGMMIGSAYTYSSTAGTTANSTICVDVDLSIPQNKSSFPQYDIGVVVDSKVVAQYSPNVNFTGTQICGTVSAFQTASFVPVMRSTDRSSKATVYIPPTPVSVKIPTSSSNSSTTTSATSATSTSTDSNKISDASLGYSVSFAAASLVALLYFLAL